MKIKTMLFSLQKRIVQNDFNSIFMNDKGPSHSLKGRKFFFTKFTKDFMTQIT